MWEEVWRVKMFTSQAAWLLLNCLVRSSIHCSMVGWRRHTVRRVLHGRNATLTGPYLLFGVDEGLEDERGAELYNQRFVALGKLKRAR